MAESTVLPTLTQIQTWCTEPLEGAADRWKDRAAAWEAAYDAVLHEVGRPGGTPWDGAAAEAAAQRVTGDRQTVLGAAEALKGAAALARSGVDDIRIARQVALDHVGAARAAGFEIEDNLTIVDTTMSSPPLPAAPHLIYCYPSARPDFWWCEGYDVGGGPYGFDSPIDVSGVG